MVEHLATLPGVNLRAGAEEALYWAVARKHSRLTACLLQNSADPYARDGAILKLALPVGTGRSISHLIRAYRDPRRLYQALCAFAVHDAAT